MNKRLFIAALCLLLCPVPANSALPNGGELPQKIDSQSATALCKLIGMEEADVLIVGDVESVKSGTINLASTIPPTVGYVSLPGNVPKTYPPARKKSLQGDDFDARLFCAAVARTPALGDDDLYNNLIKQGDGDSRYMASPRLRPVCQNETVTTAEVAQKGRNPKIAKPVRTSSAAPKKNERRERLDRSERSSSSTGLKMFKTGGSSRRDYF